MDKNQVQSLYNAVIDNCHLIIIQIIEVNFGHKIWISPLDKKNVMSHYHLLPVKLYFSGV